MEHPTGDPGPALVRWLQDRHGGTVGLAEPSRSIGDGFDSEVHLIRLAGERLPDAWRAPLVLRVKSDVARGPEAEHEAAIQGWLADQGYPSPRVLHVFGAGDLLDRPAQVMERAPGVMMLDQVRATPWRARRLCAQLATLHTRLHDLDPDGFPRSDDLLDRRLRLTRSTADTLDDSELGRALDRVEALAPRLRAAPPSVCHGDFHPLNVLVAGNTATVIDWTDAGVGDRHGDIARTLVLFELAAVAANGAVERTVLRAAGPRLAGTYRRAYERARPIDPERVRLWRPIHLLHGLAQARSVASGMVERNDDERPRRLPPDLEAELQRRLDLALAEVS